MVSNIFSGSWLFKAKAADSKDGKTVIPNFATLEILVWHTSRNVENIFRSTSMGSIKMIFAKAAKMF